MSYLKLLQTLAALGPKLVLLWPEIQKIIAAVQAIAGIMGQPAAETGTLAVMEVVREEAEAEVQVAALLAGETGAFDGTILRSVWSFMAKHPEVAALIWKLLKG